MATSDPLMRFGPFDGHDGRRRSRSFGARRSGAYMAPFRAPPLFDA